MNKPDFTLEKIKFAFDNPIFDKAIALYESGKVTDVDESIRSYTGIVIRTKPYRVSVEARSFRYAYCTCYLGKNDIYCKHMLALAISILLGKTK
ncbi:SWIM zinc finger family protein [Candidatus Roizmanbacteria bacterium]|nr:SWIM zinc finger family protein [Candidatus Roizmanbacteria bacterium]